MKCTVTDSITCPSTGTFFSRMISERKVKLILWYSSEHIIEKDKVIIMVAGHIYIDGAHFKLDVLKTMPGNDQMWHYLKKNIDCPASSDFLSKKCSRIIACAFSTCPRGKEQMI